MMMVDFQGAWENRFGSVPPLGYMLRERFKDRWFRIHSLPESKRYPEVPAKYDELLYRHNTIANEVLGHGSKCWLVVATYTDDINAAEAPELAGLDGIMLKQAYACEEPPDPLVEVDLPVNIVCWVAQVRWLPNRFDELIRLVADDKAPQLLFAEESTSRVYAPYDGGADLILETSQQRDALRTKYAEWLSEHPTGL
jgi:hypothetical protein